MKTIQRSELIAGIALSCSLVFAANGSAQMVVRPLALDAPVKYGPVIRQSVPAAPTALSTMPTMHLGNGLIDRNNLSADILNCDVCRQRLGLPPLGISSGLGPTSTATVPSTEMILRGLETPGIRTQSPTDSAKIGFEANANRMLGSPGLISSGTAEQMASQGIVFEEFKPQLLGQDAIRLSDLPPGVREQFLRSLELPTGATVTSARIKGQSSAEEIKAESFQSTLAPSAGRINLPTENAIPLDGYPKSLGAPGIAALTEQAALERTKESAKVSKDLAQLQIVWEKRIAEADAANKEVLTLLEKRTAEVTELQLQLKSQQEALEKAREEASSKVKPETKKKAPNKGKGKKAESTTIDT